MRIGRHGVLVLLVVIATCSEGLGAWEVMDERILQSVRGGAAVGMACPPDVGQDNLRRCGQAYSCCDGRSVCGGVNDDGWYYKSHTVVCQYSHTCIDVNFEHDCVTQTRDACKKTCYYDAECTPGQEVRIKYFGQCGGCRFETPFGW